MIILKYLNSKLQNGLTDWKKVYQFPEQTKKFPFIDQSKLCYNLSSIAIVGQNGLVFKNKMKIKEMTPLVSLGTVCLSRITGSIPVGAIFRINPYKVKVLLFYVFKIYNSH